VPGGGLSLDGARWIAGRANFLLAVRPLSRLFRRLFLDRLRAAFDGADLGFFGDLAHLADPSAFAAHLAAARRVDWIVYAKKPFGGPAQVLAYLGRSTHRVAIANSRIRACDDDPVAFAWKDYRQDGAVKVMRLAPDEFIRRFLLHALPDGVHRIRHFGILANGHRAERLALCRALLAARPIRRRVTAMAGRRSSRAGPRAPTRRSVPNAAASCGASKAVLAAADRLAPRRHHSAATHPELDHGEPDRHYPATRPHRPNHRRRPTERAASRARSSRPALRLACPTTVEAFIPVDCPPIHASSPRKSLWRRRGNASPARTTPIGRAHPDRAFVQSGFNEARSERAPGFAPRTSQKPLDSAAEANVDKDG